MNSSGSRVVEAPSRSGLAAPGTLPRRSFVAAPEMGAPSASSGTADRETAERLGHDFGRVAVQRMPAGGGVIQRQPSDSEDDDGTSDSERERGAPLPSRDDEDSSGSDDGEDEKGPSKKRGVGTLYDSGEDSDDESSDDEEDQGSDYEQGLKDDKKRKPDPKAELDESSYDWDSDNETLSYQTLGGAQHREARDSKTGVTTTVTTGLTPSLGFRNDAKRPPKSQGYYAYNHYGLSKGQSGLNQAVGSHQTPSWLGMKAGGKHGNVDMTSSEYNKQVEKAEKKWRDDVKSTQKYKYETKTKKERISKNLRAKEISEQKGVRWSKDRVEKRLNRLTRLHPSEERVVSQERALTNETTSTTHGPLALGVDYHYGLPARAYSDKAQEEYKKARGESSSESDSELYPNPPKGAQAKKKPKKGGSDEESS